MISPSFPWRTLSKVDLRISWVSRLTRNIPKICILDSHILSLLHGLNLSLSRSVLNSARNALNPSCPQRGSVCFAKVLVGTNQPPSMAELWAETVRHCGHSRKKVQSISVLGSLLGRWFKNMPRHESRHAHPHIWCVLRTKHAGPRVSLQSAGIHSRRHAASQRFVLQFSPQCELDLEPMHASSKISGAPKNKMAWVALFDSATLATIWQTGAKANPLSSHLINVKRLHYNHHVSPCSWCA